METECAAVPDTEPPEEHPQSRPRPVDRHGLLQHSREFLDFFWDIAKPQQETRLEATEKLLEYLRARPTVGTDGVAGGLRQAVLCRPGPT